MVTPNEQPVKRAYESPLRAEQARATRRRIVDAAARLFVRQGYGVTTVDQIAAEAGVSRKTVFASVGGKFEALRLACDWAIAGDDEPVPLMQRPPITEARGAPDARSILTAFAELVSDVGSRFAALAHVVDSAAGSDPELRGLAEEGRRQRLVGMRALAGLLAERGELREGLSAGEAADLLWLLNDPGVYHRLVIERGWSRERHRRWLLATLEAQLLQTTTR